MGMRASRYRSGRFIAGLFSVCGWLGLIVAAVMFVVGMARAAGGVAPAVFAVLGWSLPGLLLGEMGRAVFDMADHRFGQAGS